MKSLLRKLCAGLLSRESVRGAASARVCASSLLLLTLASADAARAQETQTPSAPLPPAATTVQRPAAKPGTQQRAPVARPSAVTTPPAAARPATPAPGAAPAIAPMPPRQVVTVVHRLSGWKLLAWLATSGTPSLVLDEFPSPAYFHTNIVAGYISDDGRTVVARLPEADAELASFTAPQDNLFASTPGFSRKEESEYTLITSEGRRVEAKYVGLDAATGLSLLEASSSLLPNAPVGVQGSTDDPSVGQLVRLYFPAPVVPTPRAVAATPPPQGFVVLNIDQREGRLTEVKSAPSGRLFRLVAQTPSASPEWTGAVAANEVGDVLGIVSQTGLGETEIVPVATMKVALERVMKLRSNAPQPWLGVRGDAAFQASLQEWRKFGWTPEAAMPHIHGGKGVFITFVAPGAPAALAGLRPGDLVSRIGTRDVRSPEDISLTIDEAGVGSTLDFTVLRAQTPEPLKFTVRLAAARDPAVATAEAEVRAASDAAGANAPTAASEAARAFEAAHTLKAFGLDGLRLTRRMASRLGARGGLLVVSVRPGSPAAACGLRLGDVIETADGADFTLPDARRVLLGRARAGVSLGVVRGRARTSLTLKFSNGPKP